MSESTSSSSTPTALDDGLSNGLSPAPVSSRKPANFEDSPSGTPKRSRSTEVEDGDSDNASKTSKLPRIVSEIGSRESSEEVGLAVGNDFKFDPVSENDLQANSDEADEFNVGSEGLGSVSDSDSGSYDGSSDSDISEEVDDNQLALKEFDFPSASEREDDYQNILVGFFDGDKIPSLHDIELTAKNCSYIRSYLKTYGQELFFEKLSSVLPANPTGEDILLLTNLLGYEPRNSSRFKRDYQNSEDYPGKCILLLLKAINRIIKFRTRLPSFHTIENVCSALRNSKSILVLTGAGISTSLGIPDFRSSQGFYSQMKHLGLDDPQDVFSLEVFRNDPTVFYSIAHLILPPDMAFTPLHGFIKLLQDKGKLLRNYTQNIDNLEANAGVLPEKLVQCHGSFATASCITCKYKVPGEVLYGNLRRQEIAYCPFCEPERTAHLQKRDKMEDDGGYSRRFDHAASYGVMKPDITFFGEDLPEIFHSTIKQDIENCDLLICIGTSLKVAPVSDIVNMLPGNVPQILINKDPISHCEFDVDLLGYCDQVITWLTGEKLGWTIDHKDFEKILKSGLELDIIDGNKGVYEVTDANYRQKLKEKKEKDAAIAKKQDEGRNDEVLVVESITTVNST